MANILAKHVCINHGTREIYLPSAQMRYMLEGFSWTSLIAAAFLIA